MKFLLFLLLISFNSFCQNGIKLISRAEKKVEKGDFEKALELLSKADTADYGFCGHSYFDAERAIAEARIKIYSQTGDNLGIANALNSTSYFGSKNLDSLKMTFFLKVLDTGTVKHQIDSCLNALDTINEIDFYRRIILDVPFAEKPFQISHHRMRKIEYRTRFGPYPMKKNPSKTEKFIYAIKQEAFYKLLEL